jgi:hypothetical protein
LHWTIQRTAKNHHAGIAYLTKPQKDSRYNKLRRKAAAKLFWRLLLSAVGSLGVEPLPTVRHVMDTNEYIVIPKMVGEFGDVKVTITDATFKITKSKEKKYLDKDYGKWLVKQIYTNIENQAKTSNFFGVGKITYFCSKCSTNLNTKIINSIEKEIKLSYKGFPQFIINFTLPSVICSKCGKESVIDTGSQPGSSVYGAINRAFDSEEIKP